MASQSKKMQKGHVKEKWWILVNRFLRSFPLLLIGWILQIFFPTQSKKCILVIRAELIGDLLVTTPILPFLRRHYPGWRIVFVGSSETSCLLATCPFIDEIVLWERARKYEIRYRWNFYRNLRRLKARIAIYPNARRESHVDEMVLWSGAKVRVGFTGNTLLTKSARLHIGDFAYNRLIRRDKSETQNLAEIPRALGWSDSMEIQPQVWVLSSAEKPALAFLSENRLYPYGERWALIAPASREMHRNWRSDGFAQVIRYLYNTYGIRSVISGIAQSRNVIEDIAERCNDAKPVLLIERIKLDELAVVMRYASLFVGVESGSVHLAAAAKIPTICVMGGGEPFRFFPYGDSRRNRAVTHKMKCYGCNWRCIYPTIRCLQELDVTQVWNEIRDLLSTAGFNLSSR
jgi:ADP-heptose:LPS heptosyltransferase